MADYRQPECEDTIVSSFLNDHNVFVDIVVTQRQGHDRPGYGFNAGTYVDGEGDVVCMAFGRCQLKFRLFWSPKEFQSVMFADRDCLMVGRPCSDGCAEPVADSPFHDVVREPTGQMVSVINDNPQVAREQVYAYRLEIVTRRRGESPQTLVIDPRIINRSRPQ